MSLQTRRPTRKLTQLKNRGKAKDLDAPGAQKAKMKEEGLLKTRIECRKA